MAFRITSFGDGPASDSAAQTNVSAGASEAMLQPLPSLLMRSSPTAQATTRSGCAGSLNTAHLELSLLRPAERSR